MVRRTRFTFVILHYISLKDTYACVSAIKSSCSKFDYDIVLVDNNSPNSSGIELQRKFNKNPRISVLLNQDNLGFARGNNVGISFARDEFAPDFIIVLNNDVEIKQANFLNLIIKEYTQSRFAVLAPRVLLADGRTDQYPFEPMNIASLRKQMATNYIKLVLLKLGLYLNYLKFKSKFINKTPTNSPRKLQRKENVVLQGSCLIFSSSYFDHFKEGFDPRTFMYKEEQLLYIRLQRKRLVSVYSPALEVIHNAGGSTKVATKTAKRMLLFLYENQLRSSVVLIRELKMMNKYDTK